jgi:hypothetical protein
MGGDLKPGAGEPGLSGFPGLFWLSIWSDGMVLISWGQAVDDTHIKGIRLVSEHTAT